MTSGNHDSAVRLQYAGEVMAAAGIHVRTTVEQATDPVVLCDADGRVGVYGIPFVVPESAYDLPEGERSHAAVLGALVDRVRHDADARGLQRTVVMAHAFVTGALACESEREIRVGGVGDTPAAAFDGVDYVALGHLHAPQSVRLSGSGTVLEYSGSPLAFSFSEREHTKSVTIVDLGPDGRVDTRRVPTPVPRPLMQVTGRLRDVLARAEGDLSGWSEAWVKVILTDPGRVANPMEQLRAHWPHTLVLEFAPDRVDGPIGLTRMTEADPVEICGQFVAAVSGAAPTPAQRAVLAAAARGAQRDEVLA
jgi:exonuclease SbcD